MSLDKSYHVYMLACANGRFYVGSSSNLELRLAQHDRGYFRDCYTFDKRPLKLVWSQAFPDPDQMVEAERRLKSWSQAKKIALMNGEFHLLPGLAKKPRKDD